MQLPPKKGRSAGVGRLAGAGLVLQLLLRALPGFCAPPPLDLTPVAVCGTTQAPPVMDGDLEDAAWQRATFLGPFVRVATHDLPFQRTQCRVVRDAERLYLAFECFEDRMSELVTSAAQRDDPQAWSDDCVEAFIAPGDPRSVYFHLVVTAGNVVLDERCLDDSHDRRLTWDAHVASTVKRLKDRWICELSVPLSEVSEGRPVKGAWTFAVARAEQPHQEWSSWAPFSAGFHEYQSFGSLLWADGPVVTDLSLPAPFVGRNEYHISVGQATGSQVAELQVVRGHTLYPRTRVNLQGNVGASYTYEMHEEGAGAVRVVIRSLDSSQVVYASPAVSFQVPSVLGLAGEMTSRLEAAEAAARVGGAGLGPQAVAEIGRLRRELADITREARRLGQSGSPAGAKWEALHQKTRALAARAQLCALKAHLAGLGFEKPPAFALGTETSLRKLAPDDAGYSVSRELRLQSARRERQSGQVVVAALGSGASDLGVEWTGLRGPGGAVLEHDDVEVRLVGYVTTRPPVYPVERVGRWPDPLLPLERFSVAKGEIQPLWVTVSVPATARPGQYTGKITVSSPNEPPQSVALVVEVWDFELPLHGKLQTGFGNVVRGDVSQWYGFKGDPPEDFRHKLYDLLLRNRCNPAGLYVREVWPLPEDFDWCYQRGLNALCLGSLTALSQKRLQELYEAHERLRDKGLQDLAYVYGFSGLQPEDVDRARATFSKVRRQIPGLRRVCPVAPLKPLWGYVNAWATITSEYDHLSANRRRNAGEEVWWYVCCGPRHPYANLFIDYPATDARALFWAAYKYGVTGFTYYEVAMWASNMLTQDIGDPSVVVHDDAAALAAMREGRRWPDVPWNTFTFSRYNGDGQLIYPGRNETPLPSLRLELIRDGIQDYEMLGVLDNLAADLKKADPKQEFGFLVDEAMRLTAVQPGVVANLTTFSDDPRVYGAEREKVAAQIIRLQKAVRQLKGTSPL